jgi:hypothetical protein
MEALTKGLLRRCQRSQLFVHDDAGAKQSREEHSRDGRAGVKRTKQSREQSKRVRRGEADEAVEAGQQVSIAQMWWLLTSRRITPMPPSGQLTCLI